MNFDSTKYFGILAYSNSKLACNLFTKELAQRLKNFNVSVNAVYPGAVNTNIYSNSHNSFIRVILKIVFRLFMKTPKAGCQTVIYAALDPELLNVSGKYFE